MGIETRGGFQTLFDYAMLDANTLPFVNGLLKYATLSVWGLLKE